MLLSTKLATELESMTPVMTEAEGIDNFATAFSNYFYDSTVNAISVNAGSLLSCKNALKSAMVGANSDAGLAIQNGIVAFWSQIQIDFLLIWTTAPLLISVTPPTSLSTIKTSLDSVFATNISGKLSLQDCVTNIATAIHSTQLDGIAVLGPPPPGGTAVPII